MAETPEGSGWRDGGSAFPLKRFATRLAAVVAAVLLLVGCWLWEPTLTTTGLFGERLPQQHGPALGAQDDGWAGWDAIEPSDKLSWVPCFRMYPGDFLCARLTVPMDWNRPLGASAPKVHLALVMLPGAGHALESGRLSASPVLMNPGGPGGGGVEAMLKVGPALQTVVGRHRDLISFDPRGVGASWPQADCFLDDYHPGDPPSREERNAALLRRMTSDLELLVIGLANSTDKALALTRARVRAQSQLCETKDGPDSIFRYVGTPNVARDMLAIVHAWDAWTDSLDMPHALIAQQNAADTRGKLVYWGLSYGTVLGSTFASMFPESVGRVVLDGVMSADVYFGEVWSDALADTDSVLSSFFQYCYEARDKCYFYQKSDRPQTMAARYNRLMARLEEDPVIVMPSKVRMPLLLRASDVKTAVFRMLYFPVATFPTLALLLFAIERRLDLGRLVTPANFAPICESGFAPMQYPDDSARAIGCSDRRFHWPDTLSDLQASFEDLAETSVFADFWMLIVSVCSGWNIDPVDPPEFKLDRLPRAEASAPINTSFPLLFISNTYDPITPLRGGLAMSQRFAGAGFFELLAPGHCTLAAVSLCTMAKIRAYLDEGVVPAPPLIDAPIPGSGVRATGKWEQCASDERPWKPFGQMQQLAVSASEAETAEAWREIQRGLRKQFAGLVPVARSLEGLLNMDEDLAAEMYELLSEGPDAYTSAIDDL